MGTSPVAVRLIAGPSCFVEDEARVQLARTAQLPGMRAVVGFPDLHPGRGTPVGAAFLSEEVFFPTLVGNDVGCGMALWRTDLRTHTGGLERVERRLAVLDEPIAEPIADVVDDAGAADVAIAAEDFRSIPGAHAAVLRGRGTVGRGNHFAELLAVDDVVDAAAFAALGLDKRYAVVVVHAGSRGLGDVIFRWHTGKHQDGPLSARSNDGQTYLRAHDAAVRFAAANRALVARRFLAAARGEGAPVLDLVHNAVSTLVDDDGIPCFLHRKGAAPADRGVVVLPGSRGAHTYLVAPTLRAATTSASLRSLAHGAGRKWQRAQCEGRLRDRFTVEQLRRTALGGRVVCGDRALLYEEAPQAYKDIGVVVKDLIDDGLVEVIAVLRPILTYKTARSG